ncbi:MAG: formylglycine-generating enzyme family protein [Acidobacteriota bacterium]
MQKNHRINRKNKGYAWQALALLLVFSLAVAVTCQTKRRPSEPQMLGFEFETVTMNLDGKLANRRKGQARYFVEDLKGVRLEMVEIPAGTFLMGTSRAQADQEKAIGQKPEGGPYSSCVWEMPQHEVAVPSFYMGKYEVTQAQWKAVAKLPKVSLKLDPDPSQAEGDNRPVEQISWDEAIEFCARLSKATGRRYRLPSEAEWEYACRAGTTTAFAFGENVTNGMVVSTLGKSSPVGTTGIANNFGLYDMHGSVQEWCQDYWHEDYNEAPTDGSAWETGRKPPGRVVRGYWAGGGAWVADRDRGRSASRLYLSPNTRNDGTGFRVVVNARNR